MEEIDSKYYKIVKKFDKQDLIFFKKIAKDKKNIHKFEWNNKILKTSILFEIELLHMDIRGYSTRVLKKNCSEYDIIKKLLVNKSIFDSKIIISWLNSNNNFKYNNFYYYILFLESYRLMIIKLCNVELSITSKSQKND